MPAWMVPEPLRPWLVDTVDRYCLPLEMVVVPAIGALGAVIGRTVGIQLGQFDTFVTVLNLWTAIVARPGWMKSGIINEAVKSLKRLAANAHEHFEQQQVENKTTRELLELEIDGIRGQIKTAARKGEPIDLLGRF
jgi:hypothetical protein